MTYPCALDDADLPLCVSLGGKASACTAGEPGSIPGSGRSPGEGNGTPLQRSCLEEPMDRGARWATVRGVTQSWTRLSNFAFLVSLNPQVMVTWLEA